MIEMYGGGPVGLGTLSVNIAEERETVEDMYEPYLIQKGFIMRTRSGRVATAKAYEHLGYEYIEKYDCSPALSREYIDKGKPNLKLIILLEKKRL